MAINSLPHTPIHVEPPTPEAPPAVHPRIASAAALLLNWAMEDSKLVISIDGSHDPKLAKKVRALLAWGGKGECPVEFDETEMQLALVSRAELSRQPVRFEANMALYSEGGEA